MVDRSVYSMVFSKVGLKDSLMELYLESMMDSSKVSRLEMKLGDLMVKVKGYLMDSYLNVIHTV